VRSSCAGSAPGCPAVSQLHPDQNWAGDSLPIPAVTSVPADRRIRVRTHFSLEALPPWLENEQRPDIFDYFVIVDVAAEALADTADTWERELAMFPER
jgi:hypothetical protein